MLALWLSSSSPTQAELLCKETNFDLVVIDAQHGFYAQDTICEIIKSVSPWRRVCVRVANSLNDADTCRFLDTGATVIIGPMINDRKACETLVKSCKYSPIGNRSFGPHRSRFVFPQFSTPKQMNDSIEVYAMIETKEALDNLDEILSVDNLNGVFIGPADLGLSLGYEPSSKPTGFVYDKIKHVKQRAALFNKKVGIFCNDVATSRKMYHEEKFDFVSVSTDFTLLLNATKSILHEVRKNSNHPTNEKSKL